MVHVEQLVDVFLQLSALRRIFASHLISLFQLILDDRRVLIYFQLVPALLQEVGAVVVASVGITEGDILDIVAHQGLGTRRKVVIRIVHQQRVSAHKDVHEHRLTSTIGTYDSDMLAVACLEVNWLSHTPFRHTGYAILNTDNLLHLSYFFIDMIA